MKEYKYKINGNSYKVTIGDIEDNIVKSPLPGVILDIKVNVGDTVKKGQTIIILEAMKMENNINADKDGKITAINVNKGDSVLEGNDLVIIE